jgi:hypothetical protein
MGFSERSVFLPTAHNMFAGSDYLRTRKFMRRLLAFTALTPVSLIAATPAAAETVINTARTSPVRTSTANNGAPDSVTIDAAGSIKVTGGAAVSVDSSHAASNKGLIQITDANNASGIAVNANTSGAISNSGTITIDESFAPTDTDKDGDLDGPFAQGSNRYGIRVGSGHIGATTNNGTITVEGNSSYGIAIDGPMTGNLATSGKVDVTGDDSVGLRAGVVTGNVVVEGSVSTKGTGTIGAGLLGDVSGAVRIQGSILSTGYRSTTAPNDVSKLDADDLRQGGSALVIAGNVAGGIILDIAPKDNDAKDDDEDKDGVKDAQEGAASVTSIGSAAAMTIGSADRSVTIGALAGNPNGHGLVINGLVSGQGVYKSVDANGLVIGGQGQAVTIAGGTTVNGRIEAMSLDQNATGFRIASRASVNDLGVNGTVSATGGGGIGARSSAILIDQGATLTRVTNTGSINVKLNGDKAIGTAIHDRSGTLTTIINQGRIAVDGSGGPDRLIAIDVGANTSGVTFTQSRLSATSAAPETIGAMVFGSGSDTIIASAGKITGQATFGAGNDRLLLSGEASFAGIASFGSGTNTLSLSDKSVFSGTADFGGVSGALTIEGASRLAGSLTGTSGTAVAVNGGSLALTNTGTTRLSSLAVGGQGAIGIAINGNAGTNTLLDVAGNASFAAGSKLFVSIDSVQKAPGTYVFLKAGTLSGSPTFLSEGVSLPYLFKGVVISDLATNTASVTITRKSAAELNLNASEASAFDAVTKAVDRDARVAGSVLAIGNETDLRQTIQQMLPDHAGGSFDMVTLASRSVARYLSDPASAIMEMGGWGFWIQQNLWNSSKGLGSSAAYDVSGWGTTGGAEITTGAGHFGASIGYMFGKNGNGQNTNEVTSGQLEGAVYWRGGWGGLHAFARASAAHVSFDSMRYFAGQDLAGKVERTSIGKWNGRLVSVAGGAAYAVRFNRLTIRPAASIDYYRLTEKAHQETEGGLAFDLFVDARRGSELAANASFALGYDFGPSSQDAGQPSLEIEAGRRQILHSDLGATIARFKDGQTFTLEPEARTDGWVGAIRLTGGANGFRLGAEVSAEEQQQHVSLGLRASLTAAF